MKPSFFLLGPLWLLILNSLFLASGLASSWSPCLFDTLGPCPWLGLAPPPLAKYFQSSRLAAYSAPKSWTFWRRLEPLHEIEEPVLFRHKCPARTTKEGLHILAYGACCFRLINMSDHNRAGTEPSILPETRPQNRSNCTSRFAFFTSFGPGVVVGSRESVTINYTEAFGQGKSELNSEDGQRV